LKDTGKTLFLILFFAAAVHGADVNTVLEDSRIREGESTTLRIIIPDELSDFDVEKYPSVPGLEISYQGMSQNVQIINWKKSVSIVLNFQVTGLKQGSYRIPPLAVRAGGKRFISRETAIIVIRGAPGVRSGTRSVVADVVLSMDRAYAGQPVVMRYFLLASGASVDVEGMEKLPETSGFVMRKIEEVVGDEVVSGPNGDADRTHQMTYLMIPAGAGSFNVGGGTAIIAFQNESRFFPVKKRLMFPSKRIDVVRLPDEGKPDGFHGDVGDFELRLDYGRGPVEVYGEKKFTLSVMGKGNFLTMSRPLLSGAPAAVRVLSEEGEYDIRLENDRITGKRDFIFTVIPEKEGTYDLGTISLSFFDPWAGRYKTVQTGTITLQARGGGTREKRMEFDNDKKETMDFNPVYIMIMIFVVISCVLVIVVWERRRYRLITEDNGDSDEEMDAGERDLEPAEYLAVLKSELEKGDERAFLKTAEKTCEILLKRVDGDRGAMDDIRAIKDRIYNRKFGGGTFTRDEMEHLYMVLKDLF